MLVDERALHIDVAEENSVHRVVEQHVEAFDRRHGGDLRHTEPACIVSEHHVAAQPFGDLVERRAHDAEVCLSRVRAAEALGRRTERNEVEQRLTGRANHGDNLCAGLGRSDRGRAILVDVAAGNDHVEQRRGQLRQTVEPRAAIVALSGNLCQRGFDVRAQRSTRRLLRRVAKLVQCEPPQRHRFTKCRWIEPGLGQRAAVGKCDAAGPLVGIERVDDRVGERYLRGSDAVDT